MMGKLKHILICTLFIFFSGSAAATPMDDALSALNRSDRGTAEQIYLSEAAKGNPEAYSILGSLYLGSYGGETDQKKSQDYFQKALSLYLKAAKNGDTAAQESLGKIYSDAFISKQYGVEQSIETSKKWYSLSISTNQRRAKAGDPDAILKLARAYRYGKIVEANANEASKLYKLAISKGSVRAKYELGEWMTIFPKYKEAGLHLLEDAADEGSSDAKSLVSELYRGLGDDYEKGNGVQKDSSTAVLYHMKAANYGSPYSMFKVGMAYYNGNGADLNKAKAAMWFQMAAKNGHAYAQYNLGWMLANGEGIAKDYLRAYTSLALAQMNDVQEAKPIIDQLERGMPPDQVATARQNAFQWKRGDEL